MSEQRSTPQANLFIRSEEWFERTCYGTGYTISLLSHTLLELTSMRKRSREIIHQIYTTLFGSMPVTFFTALFTGMIVAVQTGIELARIGQENSIGIIVPVSMCREMGPLMTCFAMSALIGSTIAAEIGTMHISEEIDALEVMSINPISYLVMPRIIALALVCPLLTLFSNLIGTLGGGFVSSTLLNVDFHVYLDYARNAIDLRDLFSGLLKAFVFGLTIGVIACSQGLRVKNGAEGVGKGTMKSVLFSFMYILVFDFFITNIMYNSTFS